MSEGQMPKPDNYESNQKEEEMRIIKLIAENVKRLRCVTITPEGTITTIAGKNGQGKSSVLDAIACALGGEKLVPSEPIRAGEAEAKVVVDLGDLIVTRKFKRSPPPPCDCIVSGNTEKSKQREGDAHAQDCQTLRGWGETTSTLTVTNKDGAKYPSPQAVLDKLLGKLTFDPLEFARLSSTSEGQKQQDAILRRLVKLDVGEVEARRKEAFDRRSMLKKTHAIKEVQRAALPTYKDAPAAEVSGDEVSEELRRAEGLRKAAEEAEKLLDQTHGNGEQLERQRARLLNELDVLKEALIRKKDEFARCRQDIVINLEEATVRKEAAQKARIAVPDANAIGDKLKAIEQTNAKVRANAKAMELQGEVDKLLRDVEAEHETVLKAEAEKQRMLAEAAFPVPGLGLSDDGVTFNNLPFAQAGSAEQVRVSVAIGIALNPQLKVLLIRNGNLLDADSVKAVAAQAEAADMQVWMEWVGSAEGQVGVTMVDGEVAG